MSMAVQEILFPIVRLSWKRIASGSITPSNIVDIDRAYSFLGADFITAHF